jgi:hypothetical protein
MKELCERLASLEHERWSRWMRYMFECGVLNPDGSWTMPAEKVARWHRQMSTPYADLTEQEKESDRIEVEHTIVAIRDYKPRILELPPTAVVTEMSFVQELPSDVVQVDPKDCRHPYVTIREGDPICMICGQKIPLSSET